MARVAMGRVDGDTVASILQSHGSVDDKALGAPYAEIWVYKENALLFGFRHFCES
jgi:hypothetical protein